MCCFALLRESRAEQRERERAEKESREREREREREQRDRERAEKERKREKKVAGGLSHRPATQFAGPAKLVRQHAM